MTEDKAPDPGAGNNEHQPEHLLAEARELREQGDFEAAFAVLEEVLSIAGASPEAGSQLADLKDALAWYDTLIRAESLLQKGRTDKAIGLAEEIIEKDSTNQQALLFLDRCYRREDIFQEEAEEKTAETADKPPPSADLPDRVDRLIALANAAADIRQLTATGDFQTARCMVASTYENFPGAKPLAVLKEEIKSREGMARKLFKNARSLSRDGNLEAAHSVLKEMAQTGLDGTSGVQKLTRKVARDLERKRREEEKLQQWQQTVATAEIRRSLDENRLAEAERQLHKAKESLGESAELAELERELAEKTPHHEEPNPKEVEEIFATTLKKLIQDEVGKRSGTAEPCLGRETELCPTEGDLYWRELLLEEQGSGAKSRKMQLVFENLGECEVRLRSLDLLTNGDLEKRPLEVGVDPGQCKTIPGCECCELQVPRRLQEDRWLAATVWLSDEESLYAQVRVGRSETWFDPEPQQAPEDQNPGTSAL